jgi:hypothetical protein
LEAEDFILHVGYGDAGSHEGPLFFTRALAIIANVRGLYRSFVLSPRRGFDLGVVGQALEDL